MRTNPFTDAFYFLIGNTPDHQGSGVKYLMVALFWAALIASLVIARRNWLADPAQRTAEHLWTYVMRLMIGCMWFQGSLWKLPLPVSGGLKFWLEQEIPHAAFRPHAWLVEHILAPNLWLINTPIFLTELGMGLALMIGFLVRPAAAIGILFVLQLWLGLYLHPAEWPWLYIFLIFVQGFFIMHAAGRSLGLDALLTRATVGPFAADQRLGRLHRKVA
jgi:uncharacterized membrane protein YphA (DoxX/SURF4 family)